MVGLPTETIEDMYMLADLLLKIRPDYIHLNYYIHSPQTPLNEYPQMSESLREYHLKILLKQFDKKNYTYIYEELHPIIYIRHPFIWGKKRNSRKWIREKMRVDEINSKSNLFPYNIPFKEIAYVQNLSKIEKIFKWCHYLYE